MTSGDVEDPSGDSGARPASAAEEPTDGWQPGGPHPDDPTREDVAVHSRLTHEPLSPDALLTLVAHPQAGGTGLFVGTVRDHNEGVDVTGLVYETWPDRAAAVLAQVATAVAVAHPSVRAVAVEHRTGPLEVGEVAIVAAVSAPHRAPAIAAVADLVERVKAEVPIWKQERLAAGGHRWPGIDTDG